MDIRDFNWGSVTCPGCGHYPGAHAHQDSIDRDSPAPFDKHGCAMNMNPIGKSSSCGCLVSYETLYTRFFKETPAPTKAPLFENERAKQRFRDCLEAVGVRTYR